MNHGKIIIALLLVTLLSVQLPYAVAITSGPRDPNTVVAEGSGAAWNNPNNAKTSDNVRASASTFIPGTSQRLRATDFGFSIPLGFQITGIKVEIELSAGNEYSHVKDVEVKIVKSDGSLGTENKADFVTDWPQADAYRTYGGDGDLWSEIWSLSDINDPDFGVVISVSLAGEGSAPGVARIDHVRITIYYSGPRYVGGILTPVNKLIVLAPYLALLGLVGAVTAAFATKRRWKA